MTAKLSAVFYEAACRMSAQLHHEYYSCCMADTVYRELTGEEELVGYALYSKIMSSEDDADYVSIRQTREAAEEAGWTISAYRTFMLLMASEYMRVNGQ